MRALFFFVTGWWLVSSCRHAQQALPVLGMSNITGNDTVYAQIADFSFIGQEGQPVTGKTLAGKIYVADFIFLSCPTICPKMTGAMLKAYNAYAADNRVAFLSHTIDPVHDTIARLKKYAEALGVSSAKWYFVTGSQDSIMNIAQQSYLLTANSDSTAPGGYIHGGGLLLVDKNRHIRGVYNSLQPSETTRLIGDIQTLLKEQY